MNPRADEGDTLEKTEKPDEPFVGKDLVTLAQELERQKFTKKDYIVDTRTLKGMNDNGVLKLNITGEGAFELTEHAHGQLAEKTQIPVRYYDRMRGADKIDLLALNVNAWIEEKPKRMVRTLDNEIRAILSDMYKTIDNHDILFIALDEFKKHGVDVDRADMTETNLYIKATTKEDEYMSSDTKRDDPLRRGICIRNSEVGAGAFRVTPYVMRLVCQNGMISTEEIKKIHIGERRDIGIYAQETLEMADELLVKQIRDIISATFDKEKFEAWMMTIEMAKDTPVEKPVEVFDAAIEKYDLGKAQKDDLLNHFVKDRIAGQNMWGVANAVTRLGRSMPRYARQIEFEQAGGKIIEDKELAAIATGG